MNDNIKTMINIMGKASLTNLCHKECGIDTGFDIECSLCRAATALDAAGYRKQSDTDINRLIIENKKKLDDAMRDSLNIAMGERNIDIKQAWDNGYSKGKSDTAKEFAEKAISEVFEKITQRFCDIYYSGLNRECPDSILSEHYQSAFDECKEIVKNSIAELAASFGDLCPESASCATCERRNKTADLSSTILCSWLGNKTMNKTDYCSYYLAAYTEAKKQEVKE